MSDSITVVVAARDEEKYLRQAVMGVIEAVSEAFREYEILVIDDGSTDETGKIADDLARTDSHIRTIHHPRPRSLGGVMETGLAHARMHYFIWVDGKGATTAETLRKVFALRGRADLVIPFATNMDERSFHRRLLSRWFVALLNRLSGTNLRHYGNSVLFRTEDLRHIRVRTRGYAWQPEALIRLLRMGATHVEVGFTDRFEFPGRKSRALTPRNIASVLMFFARTWWETRLGGWRRGAVDAVGVGRVLR